MSVTQNESWFASGIPVHLDELATELHAQNVAKGWWNSPAGHSVDDLNVCATKIALIHSEVSEMLEGLRKGHADDHLPDLTMEEVEAADILIRLFDYAGARGLRLNEAFVKKLVYNDHRADHKPDARAADGGKKF